MTCNPPAVPDVLRRLSVHLDTLAAEVHAVEHAIGEEFGKGAALPSTQITRLQRLDYLRQSLEDSALLSLFLADTSKGHVDPNMADRLRLASSKALLLRDSRTRQGVVSAEHVGNVDLF